MFFKNQKQNIFLINEKTSLNKNFIPIFFYSLIYNKIKIKNYYFLEIKYMVAQKIV